MSLPDKKDARTAEAFERFNVDMAAVFQEGIQLERQGLLDEKAKMQIDAKLNAISDRFDQDLAIRLSGVSAMNAKRPHSPRRRVAAWLLLLVLLGMPLELIVGENFFFFYSKAYKSALPTLFALTIPLFAITWFRLERQQRALSRRYSIWAVRWLLVYPLFVLASASIVVLSPFGWSAAGGWALGSESMVRQAKVLSLGPETKRVGKCDQKALLEIDGIQTKVCIEGRVAGDPLKAGSMVSVRGRGSFLGMFIEEMRSIQP